MWKDFFYLSKGERKGIILLLVLIVVVMGGRYLYSTLSLRTPEPYDATESLKQYEAFMASIRENDSLRQLRYKQVETIQQKELFSFNPNTADSLTFLRLGLSSFVVRNILRYRAKGGVFRTPESFAKIYGMDSVQCQLLLPYLQIEIPKIYSKETYHGDTLLIPEEPLPTPSFEPKYPAGTVVDLNLADTTELKRVPGIGSSRAKMIVAYRNKLGGYHHVDQLGDIKMLPDSLRRWFSVNSDYSIRCLNLNKMGVERLKSHPYINFYQGKVIVEHRKKKGRLKSLEELALYEEFTTEDLERMRPYVSFE